MPDEIERKRLSKRKRIAERRRVRREQEIFEQKKDYKVELLIKIGIFAVLALIPVDFFMNVYPILTETTLSLEIYSAAILFKYSLGILFGLGLYYAGKRMTRNTGLYGGIFQIDGAIIGILNVSIFLIVNPLLYTPEYLIVSSLYYGFETVSSIALLIFTLTIAFFLILVGTNSQKRPLKHIVMITGLLWIINLFIPFFLPMATSDITVGLGLLGFTWLIYVLTSYCLWKMITDEEGLKSIVTEAFKLK